MKKGLILRTNEILDRFQSWTAIKNICIINHPRIPTYTPPSYMNCCSEHFFENQPFRIVRKNNRNVTRGILYSTHFCPLIEVYFMDVKEE